MNENLLNAFQIFSTNIHSMAWYWVIWIYVMVLVNGITPLFFLPRFTSIIVLLSAISGFYLGLILTHAIGYSRILGLMHFPWIPMVSFQIYYLYKQSFKLKSSHDYWLSCSLLVSTLSLFIDFYDVYKYLAN